MRLRGMVELMLPIPQRYPDIPIIMDFVNVNIPALLGFYALDGNNLLFKQCNRIFL